MSPTFLSIARLTPLSSLATARERNSIRSVAHVNQWIIGLLDPINQLARQERQCLLAIGTVRHTPVDRQHTQVHVPALSGQGLVASFVESSAAASCALR